MKRRHSKRKIKKNLLAAVLLLGIIAVAGILICALQVPEVTFSESLRFSVGTKLVLSDVVENVKFGKLTEPDMPLDSSKEGLVKFTFNTANLLKVKSEKEIMIDFYKPESPKSEEKTDPVEKPDQNDAPGTDAPSTTTTKPPVTTTKPPVTTTKPPVTTTKPQTGNENNSYAPPFGEKGSLIDGVYTTSNGKTLEIKNGLATVDGILIANKSYSLPKSYTSTYLTKEAEQAYYRLRDDAKNAGFPLSIKSAYRSWNDQNYIFNNYVKRDGLDAAMTYSARPGHSEHQTGLAMDILTSSTSGSKTPQFKPALDWLADNAYKHGFILRYPEGKTHITGYIFEPWHYRYVGTELAEILYNNGDWITLEEYFGIDSVYHGY